MTQFTNRLYYDDSRITTHKAIIVEINAENNSVILDETIFHPQGGGQPSDLGTINDIALLKAVNSPDSLTVCIYFKIPTILKLVIKLF